MGSAINRGLTFKMAQTPVQHYLPKLMQRIEKGEIDPSFVITHTVPLEQGPATVSDVPRQAGWLHQGDVAALTTAIIEVYAMNSKTRPFAIVTGAPASASRWRANA